jgi:hypothetical protein
MMNKTEILSKANNLHSLKKSEQKEILEFVFGKDYVKQLKGAIHRGENERTTNGNARARRRKKC